jgi:hypothetical protein
MNSRRGYLELIRQDESAWGSSREKGAEGEKEGYVRKLLGNSIYVHNILVQQIDGTSY